MFRIGEALTLCGVSEDAYRHWRTVLVPLRGRDGRGASLTYAELVALATLQTLKELGLSISRLAPHAPEIFDFVADHLQTGASPACIYIGPQIAFGGLTDLPAVEAAVVVRVDLIAQRIRANFNRLPESSQQLQLL